MMRLIMKSGEMVCNIRVDAVEKVDDVLYAYRKNPLKETMIADEFVGMFSLGCVDFLYLTGGKHENG